MSQVAAGPGALLKGQGTIIGTSAVHSFDNNSQKLLLQVKAAQQQSICQCLMLKLSAMGT